MPQRSKSKLPNTMVGTQLLLSVMAQVNFPTLDSMAEDSVLYAPKAGTLYLSLRPTNARIWHKAVFKVGPGRRAEAHTRPARPKIPLAPSAFPFFGAPQAPGRDSIVCLAWSEVHSQLTSFSKSPNSQPIASGHNVIHTPATFPIWGLL